MRNPFRFVVELTRQPLWITLWVMFLMIVNGASVVFWEQPVAQLIFMSFLISAMLMMGLYSRFGFEKILGLGHAPWFPVLLYLLTKISTAEGLFKGYLVVLAISIAVSLAFDTIDVWNYFSSRKKM